MLISLRARLLIFASTLLLLIGVVAWSAHLTWRLAYGVQRQVGTLQGESLRLADHFRASVQALNTSLLLFAISENPTNRDEFDVEGRALQGWLADQEQELTSPKERNLLRKMRTAVEEYRAKAVIYFNLRLQNKEPDRAAALLEDLQENSEGLLAIGFSLADAHRARLEGLLESMQRSVDHWQVITFGALILLVGLVGWLSVIIFRETILPLRAKLLESRAALEHQEKLASLGVLAAGVAHEIRNPLTAIKARLYTLRKGLADLPDASDDAETIEQEISRLERIVRSFLQFARPPEPELVTLNGDELLEEVARLLGPEWQDRGVTIKMDTCAGAMIQADRQQLKQALINLIQNAAESMPSGGVVTLSSRVAPAALGGRSVPGVYYEVADTGSGMTPEVQARLFDPFFTTKSAGTGLGLALTARILEKHGGVVRCQTQPNKGTTFSLVLPQSDVSPAS